MILLFDLAGELAERALRVPLPGPVIGMALLFAALGLARGLAARIERGAGVLLGQMSLFFVPAGVGVVAQLGLLGAEWLAIGVALVGSTLLALVASAGAFTLAARAAPRSR